MEKNMGTTDTLIRLIIAVVIAGLFYTGIISGTIAVILLVLASIFVITGLLSFCPLYTLLGISTCKKKES